MILKRKNNWPAALALFFEEKKPQPFDWATNNCGFFACDWLAIVVGVDPAEKYRPKINSAATAARVLKRAGGIEAIAARAAKRYKWPETTAAYARRGDIVSHVGKDGTPALGVCDGSWAVFADKNGLLRLPVLDARKVWRIG